MLQLLGQEPRNIEQRWIIFIISYKTRSDGLFQVEYRYVDVVFMVKGNFLSLDKNQESTCILDLDPGANIAAHA